MEGWHIFLVIVSALVSSSHICVCGSVMEVTVNQGDNITLYCDCKTSVGVYIIWYRNCSHNNQPSLVLISRTLPPRFDFVKNQSSESYDLLIQNLTESDEGLYYCGTTEPKVEDQDKIYSRNIYSYGNLTTRIVFNSLSADNVPHMSSWMLPIIPAITVLSSLISFILVYLFCQKTESQRAKIRTKTRMISSQNQDKDVCWTQVVFLPQDA
ncbi:uncharacterized protein LOC121507731 isoform X2 [Cheilinus undulatus]|uniref:uncharacterized protein LOC121507731 isoform X2 n=1 Tax=Cheilinus undulatus TaxID=241271 RepID=UPI001BD6A9D2|nr:uncharacterized protein LOC121507731 isoform X2 [Cheilinus undulatus]